MLVCRGRVLGEGTAIIADAGAVYLTAGGNLHGVGWGGCGKDRSGLARRDFAVPRQTGRVGLFAIGGPEVDRPPPAEPARVPSRASRALTGSIPHGVGKGELLRRFGAAAGRYGLVAIFSHRSDELKSFGDQ